MANTQKSNAADSEVISTNPIVVVQDIGELSRNFLREVGSLFWFVIHTFTETLDHVQYFSDFRQQFGFSCLFQHRLCLLSRSGQRCVTYPRHHYGRSKKLPL